MSMPPQLIRVKRKRVEETPVTFLQFDEEGVKRHRSGSHWAYQRRDPLATGPASTAPTRDVKPIIHVSQPTDTAVPSTRHDGASPAAVRPIARAKSPSPARQRTGPEPRRFHISRSMLAPPANQSVPAGVSKRGRAGPAIFVERTRKKIASQLAQQRMDSARDQVGGGSEGPGETRGNESKHFKKPGSTAKTKVAAKAMPLPASLTNRHNEEMDKIAADMNDWVLNEIGANLQDIESEKQQERQQAERARFRPKAPAQRYQERQKQPAMVPPGDDDAERAMTDISEDEGEEGDWIIDEYVRIPVNSMALDITPADVGLLVLDGEEESMLFFGPEHDEDDDFAEDDEDENAENYYTADYPDDEVESDDEYGRRAYEYRTAMASDDEEFDNDAYDDDDDDSDGMVIEHGADDDTTMARIRAYNMKRNAAFP